MKRKSNHIIEKLFELPIPFVVYITIKFEEYTKYLQVRVSFVPLDGISNCLLLTYSIISLAITLLSII
jgi:hypothetical protein